MKWIIGRRIGYASVNGITLQKPGVSWHDEWISLFKLRLVSLLHAKLLPRQRILRHYLPLPLAVIMKQQLSCSRYDVGFRGFICHTHRAYKKALKKSTFFIGTCNMLVLYINRLHSWEAWVPKSCYSDKFLFFCGQCKSSNFKTYLLMILSVTWTQPILSDPIKASHLTVIELSAFVHVKK